MESIDALAKAVNEYKGGLVLVSHDMRLISQVAKEIWICDHKQITKHKGDIQSFKMDMRAQMGIEGQQIGKLRGDASVMRKDNGEADKPTPKKAQPQLEVVAPPSKTPQPPPQHIDDNATATASTSASTFTSSTSAGASTKGSYVPPHLRRKMAS